MKHVLNCKLKQVNEKRNTLIAVFEDVADGKAIHLYIPEKMVRMEPTDEGYSDLGMKIWAKVAWGKLEVEGGKKNSFSFEDKKFFEDEVHSLLRTWAEPEEASLSLRARTTLEAHGLSLHQAKKMPEKELKNLNFGGATLKEIRELFDE